ncbi:hypothetical protein D3C81_1667180 [compost metagenome]
MRWALERHDPQDWLLRAAPEAAALAECLIRENDQVFKLHLNHYKYADRYPQHPQAYYREQACEFLQRLEDHLQRHAYLLADHPSLADVAIMPFIRQFAAVDPDWFAQSPYRQLQAWLQGFVESALFKSIMAR